MGILLPHHVEHLRASGLSDETIASAQLRSVTDPAEAGAFLRWTGAGPVPAIALPNLGYDGAVNFTYLRPDVPRQKGDRVLKYETPVGQSPRPYFAPGAAALLADPRAPLVFTEGIKKALAVRQAGLAAVSAPGVSCWHDVAAKRAGEGWRLHPEVAAIALRGRRCEVVFDGGDTTRNHDVILAEARLARMLLDTGATVRLARVPFDGDGKVGVDDWLARSKDPERDLRDMLSRGREADPLLRSKQLRVEEKTEIWRAAREDLDFLAAVYVAPDILFDLVASDLRGKLSRESLRKLTRDFGTRTAPSEDAPPAPSAEEEAKVDALLRAPDLVSRLLDAVGRTGLVGERQAALFVLLSAISRKLERPINIVLKAPSSAGKNHLCRSVLSFFPEDEVRWVSGLSEQALRYLDEPGALKNKVLVLDEIEGGDRATYDLRVLTSEARIELWVPERQSGGGIHTVRRVVEGPLALITTTTQVEIHDENETRMIEVTLDSSAEQTRAIVKEAILERVEVRGDVAEERRLWRAALALIEPRPVSIPRQLAARLEAALNTTKLRARRDVHKLLTLVDAHAVLHQRQRGATEGMVVVATEEDVEAIISLAAVFRSPLKPSLATAVDLLQRKYGWQQFTSAGAEETLGVSDRQRRRTLNALVEEGLLELVKEGARGKSSVYQFVERDDRASDGSPGMSGMSAQSGLDRDDRTSRTSSDNGATSGHSTRRTRESDVGAPEREPGEDDDQPDLWDLPKGGP